MTSGWRHYYDMRDARRELGGELAKLGWEVDDSKPVDEPQTDYFPSTSWYPEWAKKNDYTLYFSAYDIRKTHPVPKEANWVLLKGNTAITWGKNYRPAETVAQKINQFGLCVITGALVAAAVTDNPKIASLPHSVNGGSPSGRRFAELHHNLHEGEGDQEHRQVPGRHRSRTAT